MAEQRDRAGGVESAASRIDALEQRFDRLERLLSERLTTESKPTTVQVLQPDRRTLARNSQRELDRRMFTRDRDEASAQVALASGKRQFIVAIIQPRERGGVEIINPPLLIGAEDPETAETRYRRWMGITGVMPPSQYYVSERTEARPDLRERADDLLARATQRLEEATKAIARLSA